MNFHLIDWAILVAYLGATVYFGLRAQRSGESMEGYFVAGRKVRVALGVSTLIATEIGIVTFMYAAELGYLTGFACFFLGLASLLGYVLIGKTGFIVTALRRLKVMTIPEFYELRYGRGVRVIGGILLFLGGVLNMGIFLKFDGIFLAETIGLGQGMLVVVMIVMLVIVLLYTILGGMLSVVVTDFLQFVVLVVGMLVATIGILHVVSLADLVTVVTQQFGQAGVDPFVHPRFGWAFILWIIIASIAASALWQPATSKVLSSESSETGRKVFLYSGLALAGRFMIPMFWGVAALAILGPHVASTLAMPRLLGMVVPTGFLGLMIAGMMAASMSTYSAYLLAWSSVATRDILDPLRRVPFSEKGNILITRLIAAVIGCFLLIFGIFYEIPETAFQYLALTGAMYTAGALGCVACGIYWKKANATGAYASLIMGAAAPVLFLFLTNFKGQMPSWLWFLVDVNISGLLSFVLAGCGMAVGSLLTQRIHPPRILHYPEGPQ
jgi:solute:Na+ symporter, SSS family